MNSSTDAVLDSPEAPVADEAVTSFDRRMPWWMRGLAGACVAYLVVAVTAVGVRAPLGHDEAVYALRARDISMGWDVDLGSYWASYRAPGLPIMLWGLNGVIGEHVVTMRLVVVALGLLTLIGTWWIAAEFGSRAAGAIGAGLLSVTAGFGSTATRLLADLPGAAFAVVAVAVYVRDLRRGRLRHSLWLVPALAAASTVSRFGAPIMLASGLAAAGLVFIPQLWRRRDWVPAVQSVGLAAALGLIIYVIVFTNMLTHGPASPARANQLLFERKGLTAGSGIEDLREVMNPWSDWPTPLWSVPVAGLWLFGIVLAVIGAALGRRSAAPVVFGIVAGAISLLGITVSVGLVVENYLVLSLPFWAVAAGCGYAWVARELAGRVTTRGARAAAVVALAVVATALVVDASTDTRDHHRSLEGSLDGLRRASVATGESLGEPCSLVTGFAPQAGYYSGCRVVPFTGLAPDEPLPSILYQSVDFAERRVRPPSGREATAILVVESGKRQPTNEALEQGAGLERRLVQVGSIGGGNDYAWSARVEDCVWDQTCIDP